jgi:transcriptional regulator with XRE-family HTH domain
MNVNRPQSEEPAPSNGHGSVLTGHALRNAHLRQRALQRAATAPPLAGAIVRLRAATLGLTRLEFSRRCGVSRGTLRDLELGVHVPTRRIMRQLVDFCQAQGVPSDQLEELRRLYTGDGDDLGHLLSRLELQAGSSRELARRVGISPATLWEYKRGNFPLPLALLKQLCQAVGEEEGPAEEIWHRTEQQRLLRRGYPEALAQFWVFCGRAGYAERHLFALGLSTATVRRMRYLELPPWEDVAVVAGQLCREGELETLRQLWQRDEQRQKKNARDGFGLRLKALRKKAGIGRREIADLFGIRGKKPARIIKYIEEDGFYSVQAYPAGLAALLTSDPAEQAELLRLWEARRRQFHSRHRPETRVDLRLRRELYGFELADMEAILGYSSLEYQRIERGVTPLTESAQARILQAISQAGQKRLAELLQTRQNRENTRQAWRRPQTVREMLERLARREGGFLPLARRLKSAGLKGVWAGRLRAIAAGLEVPSWYLLRQIGEACGIEDLTAAHADWLARSRQLLEKEGVAPLGVEVRLLIAEVSPTPTAFSQRLAFNKSVLIRDLQRIDRDIPVAWFHVERIVKAAGLTPDSDRWRSIHAWWYAAANRSPEPRRRRPKAS